LTVKEILRCAQNDNTKAQGDRFPVDTEDFLRGLNLMRVCSLLQYMEIERAGMAAWRALSEYHYRGGRCGAVDQIFALRMNPEAAVLSWYRLRVDPKRPVGVIVYAMPLVNVALRNRATNNRYVGLATRAMSLQLLNREMRSISRVVIHPQYRGIGLAQYLVRETLGFAGTELVEALASMGRVNPFFAKAGMQRYDGPPGPASERLLSAFAQTGIDPTGMHDVSLLLQAVGELGETEQIFLEREMRRFAESKNRVARRKGLDLKAVGEIVIQSWMTQPVYYLWKKSTG
jgi:GNAT superfamily N-acetyltransferase